MPLYEYECDACGRRFERIQKFSDPPVATCPTCNGSVRKLFSSPAIQFKGSGFYITDYARSGGEAGVKAGKTGEAPSSGATDKDKKTADAPASTGSTDTASSTTAKAEPAKTSSSTTPKD